MNVLIVGGAGYIGCILTRCLLKAGFNIRIFDNFLYGGESFSDLLTSPLFDARNGDIRDKKAITFALQNIETVINLASLDIHTSRNNPKAAGEINNKSAYKLAMFAKTAGIKRFLFASTCSIYGNTKGKLATEDFPTNPISHYAKTKLAAEYSILKLADEDFHPCILRLATVFGLSPRMRFDTLVNELIRDAFVDKKMTIYHSEAWRPFIHIEDAASTFIHCLQKPTNRVHGQIFNVGYQNYKKKDISSMIIKYLPETKIKLLKNKGSKRNYQVSYKKTKKLLGFNHKKSIETGIIEIVNALRLGFFPNPKSSQYSNVKWLEQNR